MLGEKMGGLSDEKDLIPLRMGMNAAGGMMTSRRIPSAEKWYALARWLTLRGRERYVHIRRKSRMCHLEGEQGLHSPGRV